jgi:hypothetical protein
MLVDYIGHQQQDSASDVLFNSMCTKYDCGLANGLHGENDPRQSSRNMIAQLAVTTNNKLDDRRKQGKFSWWKTYACSLEMLTLSTLINLDSFETGFTKRTTNATGTNSSNISFIPSCPCRNSRSHGDRCRPDRHNAPTTNNTPLQTKTMTTMMRTMRTIPMRMTMQAGKEGIKTFRKDKGSSHQCDSK